MLCGWADATMPANCNYENRLKPKCNLIKCVKRTPSWLKRQYRRRKLLQLVISSCRCCCCRVSTSRVACGQVWIVCWRSTWSTYPWLQWRHVDGAMHSREQSAWLFERQRDGRWSLKQSGAISMASATTRWRLNSLGRARSRDVTLMRWGNQLVLTLLLFHRKIVFFSFFLIGLLDRCGCSC